MEKIGDKRMRIIEAFYQSRKHRDHSDLRNTVAPSRG